MNIGSGASIIVQPGAWVCIETGVNFNVQGSINIQNGANIGANPVLLLVGTNCNNTFCSGQTITFNNEALSFDGTNDFAQVPDNALLNFGTGDFTMEAIIKSNLTGGLDGIQTILSKRSFAAGAAADGYIFGIWSSGQLFVQMAGAPNVLDNNALPIAYNLYDGQCHHVALKRTGNLLRFYVDGQPTNTFSTGRNISSTGVLRIGRNGPSGLFYNGQIGEIRLWNFSRPDADILNDIDNNIVIPQANLIALWDFTGVNDQDIIDISGNGNNGFLGDDNTCNPTDPSWIPATNLDCTVSGNFRLTHNTNEEENILEVNAYPNPFNNDILISLNSIDDKASVTITNTNGVEVYSNGSVYSNSVLSVGKDLPSGIYFMSVTTAAQSKVVKLIKH